ncbi:Sugar transporter ERD6-like 6, partial [Zootermopsis nevadensis]
TASILSVSQIFGCLLCGPVLDAFGRKRTLIFTSLPFVVGWAVLCATPQPAQLGLLLLGRVITGVACGIASIPATVYVGEMASDRLRGMLVTWPSVFMSAGILLVYLLGWGLRDDWRLVSGIAIAFPLVASVLVTLYLKETPSWLLSRGRGDEAEESFRWIREVGSRGEMPEDIRQEFQDLLEAAKKKADIHDEIPQISTPDVWKPLVIHNFYFFFMQFGGIQVVSSYAVDIMESAGVSMDPYGAAALLGGVQLAGGVGASFAFSLCGRRVVSMVSGLGMAVTMVGLGIYLEVDDGSSELSWLPLVLILGYIAFANVGFNLIAWGLLGELYPTKVAGLAGGVTTCLANLMGFAAIKLYPAFQDFLRGDSGTSGGAFSFFGAVAGAGTLFVFLFLPETLKKSLEQIGEEFRQPCGILVSFVSSATLLSAGMNLGFSAVALPHMQDPAGTDRLTVEEGSWFASTGFISTLAGCLTCGPLLDKLGRKRTLLVINTPFVLGWLLMWTAPKPAPAAFLYFARLLNGLGAGMVSIPATIYIAEMATSHTRCLLVTWPSLAVSVGILAMYALGLVIQDWRTIAAISASVPVITALSNLVFIRESPIWLLAQGRDEEAETSFEWIRHVKYKAMSKELRAEFQTRKNVFRVVFSALRRSDVWKPLVILNSYFFFMQFSGIPVLIAYAVNIMISEGVALEPYLATLLLGVVKFVFEIAAGFVQNRQVRSGLGMAVCMLGLGVYNQVIVDPDMRHRLDWVPLLLMLGYVVSAAMGFLLIPWAMLGEVFPATVTGLACGITTCAGNFFGFASIKLFPTFVVLLGGSANSQAINCTEGVFYLHGGITAVAVLFIYLYLPETFRKTLKEISDGF